MNRNILSLNNIGVKFALKGKPRDSIANWYKKFLAKKNEFWALRNISFDLKEGEILFIIGRNGAGKSTLLKVIAETLFPDEGKMFTLRCKKSFVSMGLGFRSEFSGIDNINIALKLMELPSDKIDTSRQEIIEFTQLKNFIYEPVGNYSAGMRARLAFAIATSNTPDILIMDEVMNTGDQQFRGKCTKRLKTMVKKAKAVVVCSHDLESAENMATKVAWIEKGKLVNIDDAKIMLQEYKKFIQNLVK